MYKIDLYIDVYTTDTFVYTCICKRHTCIKLVTLIFFYFLNVFIMKICILEHYTIKMFLKGIKFESILQGKYKTHLKYLYSWVDFLCYLLSVYLKSFFLNSVYGVLCRADLCGHSYALK